MLSFLINHAYAQGYQPLAPIQGLTNSSGKIDIVTYIPAAVKLLIGVAGGLAVIFIIIGGIEYMSTDAFTGKSSAKERIRNAIFGLILAIGAYTILYTVNPKLVDFNIKLNNVGITTPIGNNLGGTPEPNPVDAFICTPNVPCKEGTLEDGTECTPEKPCVSGYLRCNTCVVVNQNQYFPTKPANVLCLPPHPCQIELELFMRLKDLAQQTAPFNPASQNQINWWVTEAFPPTAVHISDCHNSRTKGGMCVDAAIKDLGSPDIGYKIVAFTSLIATKIYKLNNKPENFEWETPSFAERDRWRTIIDDWFEAHPNNPLETGPFNWKEYTKNKIKANIGCPGCAFHVHINSPNLTN